MADLVITFSDVVAGSNTQLIDGVSGETTILAGHAVYRNASDGLYYRCDSDAEASAVAAGIAVNSAATNQRLSIQVSGNITISSVATVGMLYYVSSTPGGIQPYADLGSTEWVTLLGAGLTTSSLKLMITVSGVQVP